jgi:hypothetical protein
MMMMRWSGFEAGNQGEQLLSSRLPGKKLAASKDQNFGLVIK